MLSALQASNKTNDFAPTIAGNSEGIRSRTVKIQHGQCQCPNPAIKAASLPGSQ
jgi:hypothetical protein